MAVVKFLVGSGAHVGATGFFGETALGIAAYEGHLDVVEYLVGSGADIAATDNRGRTPRDIAVQYGHLEVVEYFDSLDDDDE